MWIRKIGLGILIGVVLCSVMVNAEERNSRKAEPMTVMERMREIPHKIYGKKKSRNKMRKCACPPVVKVKCGSLDEKQCLWWKKLYFNGLGEFFYRNNIDADFDSFMQIVPDDNGKHKYSCEREVGGPGVHGGGAAVCGPGGKELPVRDPEQRHRCSGRRACFA